MLAFSVVLQKCAYSAFSFHPLLSSLPPLVFVAGWCRQRVAYFDEIFSVYFVDSICFMLWCCRALRCFDVVVWDFSVNSNSWFSRIWVLANLRFCEFALPLRGMFRYLCFLGFRFSSSCVLWGILVATCLFFSIMLGLSCFAMVIYASLLIVPCGVTVAHATP